MLLTAVVLTVWAIFCVYDMLGPTLVFASRPLIAGTVAGLIIGNVTLGMAVGATMELAALGVYTYGGASIPDYTTGAIVGTTLANASGGSFSQQVGFGLALGIPAAVLLLSLDPVGRFLPTFWMHRADYAALEGRTREMTVLHWTAFIPWAAVRVVPTFFGVYYSSQVAKIEHAIPPWFTNGMTLVGAILPAVGFAMLLKMLPVAKYWYMLLIGYVLYGYLKVPLPGIALFGLAIAIIFVTLRPSNPTGTGEGPPPPSTGVPPTAARPSEEAPSV
jgi:mannose/fructose/N-acetylgalactosamine-specific phosphotransferase system component IIC